MTHTAAALPSRRALLSAGFGASLEAGAAPASATEVLTRAALYADRASLIAEPPASGVEFAYLLGVARAGLGAALFRRVDREPPHGGKILDRNAHWWALLPGETLSAAQFGALGDGRTDDAPALQAAIDYALYVNGAPKTLVLPLGLYRIDDTLHIGYGDRQTTLELRGAPGDVEGCRAGLYPRFNDRPGLNIQGGRRVRLHGVSVFGVNSAFLRERYNHLQDRSDRAAWVGPLLGPTSASRHAPHAGIVIDGFSGPMPDPAYPAPRRPAFLAKGQAAQHTYEKSFSSDTILENCRIEGFYVGLAIQPGQVPDASNGDFVTLRDCDLSYNVIAIADGHSDSRCNQIENSQLHFCHTAIDSLSHGPGFGSYHALISGASFDNVAQILNVDLGGSKSQGPYPIRLHGCYGESLWRLGAAGGGRDTGPGLCFEACKFEFSIKNKEFSPKTLLDYSGGTVVFRQSVLMGGFGLFAFNGRLICDGLCLRHPQNLIFDFSRPADRLAHSFCCGIFAPEAGAVHLSPLAFFDVSGASSKLAQNPGLDGEAFAIANAEAARPLPWWVRALDDGESRWPLAAAPKISLDLDETPATLVPGDGADSLLHLPAKLLEILAQKGVDVDLALGAGDLLIQPETLLLAFIVSRQPKDDGVDLMLRQLNGLRARDGGQSFEAAERLRPDRKIFVLLARRFYPAPHRQMIAVEKNATSATIKDRSDGRSKIFAAPGDFILGAPLGSSPPERAFAAAKLLGVRSSPPSVSLSKPALRDFWGDCPIFIKASR